MSKKLIISISAIVGVFVLAFGIYQSDASQAAPKLSVEDVSDIVKDQYSGEITEIELEKDQNRVVYDVEVVNGDRKYEMKLDGNTGEIVILKEKSAQKDQIVLDDSNKNEPNNQKEELGKQEDINKDKPIKQETPDQEKEQNQEKNQNQTEKPTTNHNKKTVIDAKEAIDIALNEFSGTVTDLELEKEDGRLIYEIEIKAGREEAEIEIDAYTGEILVIDIDTD